MISPFSVESSSSFSVASMTSGSGGGVHVLSPRKVPESLATRRIGIVTAEFNALITSRLEEGAIHQLLKAGLSPSQLYVCKVPGAVELPMAAQWMIQTQKLHAVIALGCVIQGDTDHYDYVCQSVTQGLSQVSLQTNCPALMGVLTVDTLEQALQRVGGKGGNKGAEVAQAALEMSMLYCALTHEASVHSAESL
ncbi:MAG: 6,7-dimethyl-8-ribityllumazine synthase [Vampirovibrionales bacterium]